MSKLIDIINKATKINLNKASKASVRELEENSPGNYIAFVDDGLDSFDIHLELKEGEVIKTNCDCQQTSGLCWHILAVLLKFSNDSTAETQIENSALPSKTRRRKFSESEILLKDLNQSIVTDWLIGVFKKNKPLEQQFLLEFAPTQKEFTAAEVEEILNKAIDSVLKNRKKAKANEIKKVVDLLTQALSPIELFIWAHIQEPISFEIGETIINTIDKFNLRIIHNSNRLEKFTYQFLHQFALNINNIKDENVWNKIINTLFEPLSSYNNYKKPDFEFLLLREIYYTSLHKNKKDLALKFQELVKTYKQNKVSLRVIFNSFFLDVFIEQNIFADNSTYFTPIRYENEYNLKLLNKLKNTDRKLAIFYCKEVIRTNARKDHNIPFLDLLRTII